MHAQTGGGEAKNVPGETLVTLGRQVSLCRKEYGVNRVRRGRGFHFGHIEYEAPLSHPNEDGQWVGREVAYCAAVHVCVVFGTTGIE